jgi:hypothetical protein
MSEIRDFPTGGWMIGYLLLGGIMFVVTYAVHRWWLHGFRVSWRGEKFCMAGAAGVCVSHFCPMGPEHWSFWFIFVPLCWWLGGFINRVYAPLERRR